MNHMMFFKRTLVAMLAVSSLAACAALDDALISFSTVGPDSYADGSTVLDREVYALVWSSDGVFDGFAADGQPLDANDRVVVAVPLAQGGRCPEVLFQVPAATASELKAGRYAVYLLDTRVATDGTVKPRGTTKGKLVLVNGYGPVTASVSVTAGSDIMIEEASMSAAEASGQVASELARASGSGAQPKIKNVRVEGDKVCLTVENLKGYMRVQGGADVKANDMTGAAVETTGAEGDVILIAPKLGTSGFYRVIRN